MSTSTPPTDNKKNISAYDLEMYGSIYGDDACGNCTDAHSFFKDVKSKSKKPIHYSQVDMDSLKAKKLIEEKGITGKPYIKACPIYEDGSTREEDCKEFKEWNKNDWAYLLEGNTDEGEAATAPVAKEEKKKA